MSKRIRVLVTLNKHDAKIIEEVAKEEFKHRMATAMRSLTLEAIAKRKNEPDNPAKSDNPATFDNPAKSDIESMVS